MRTCDGGEISSASAVRSSINNHNHQMAETNATSPVVASEERPPAELVTGSPPPTTTTMATVVSRSTSPSTAPPEETETTAEPTATEQRESPTDHRVVALRAMFPDYDDAILCVKNSVRYLACTQSRATGILFLSLWTGTKIAQSIHYLS
jgi:hypothetical protein